MIITKKHLARRTFLQGMGAAIGLPMLDAMTPALSATHKSPVRMAFTYIPNGVTYRDWKPKTVGSNFEFSPILKPLEKYREDLLVLSGLDHHNAEALGDGGGDHARAGACFLTGVHPRKTAGADIQSGISVDQIAAKSLASMTRISSLELGCEDSRTVGGCDSGYSCAYTNSISWRGPQTPMAPETNPRVVFERLFGDEDFSASPEQRAQKAQQRKSILDLVRQRTQSLVGDLGAADKRKIDEYLTGIRELEQRIQMAEKDQRRFVPEMEKPTGVPVAFADYIKMMFDLQVLAFQADVTRVSTLLFGREASVRTYNEIGVSDPHHPLSHHRNIPENHDKLTKINTFHTTLYSYFLDKMKATKDGDGTLLDHSMLVYGGAICDGNSHSHSNLPILLAGRGDGRLKPGRHIEYPKGTPTTNLYLSMLERMNVPTEKLGDSTGQLEHLTEL
ncbi:DUF1552 domain-containing protein [Bryobacter aggregatus]|uniref:DUF1552 domain-containing protein n=1 Tax=Bryobacter aggregatus TaxID=360054 RepID=UPI0004E12E2D|nr:DUF1552 domain-containing protein [Bryobacter aggregatus]